jgi:hypothetical protein
MTPTLEIIIPTMPHRAAMLEPLLEEIHRQLQQIPAADRISITTDDRLGISIGIKRESLMQQAAAEYLVMIDDDDWIAPDYLPRVWEAIQSRPDCVGIAIRYTHDGKDDPHYYEHSLRHRQNIPWTGAPLRTPHHLCPMKSEIAKMVHYPDVSWGEDYAFALGVLPFLQTEVWLGEGWHYHYRYNSNKVLTPPTN